MKPVLDPTSDKYPDRVFFGGRWQTPEQIERHLARNARYLSSSKGRASMRARASLKSEAEAARAKAVRARRSARSLCTRCGLRAPASPLKSCRSCLDQVALGNRARHRYGLPAPLVRELGLNIDTRKERVHADR